MFNLRTEPALMFINITQDGSLSLNSYPHELHYDLKDVLQISVGPKDNYDGIKACLTYNPPGVSKPGYQADRGVSF